MPFMRTKCCNNIRVCMACFYFVFNILWRQPPSFWLMSRQKFHILKEKKTNKCFALNDCVGSWKHIKLRIVSSQNYENFSLILWPQNACQSFEISSYSGISPLFALIAQPTNQRTDRWTDGEVYRRTERHDVWNDRESDKLIHGHSEAKRQKQTVW